MGRYYSLKASDCQTGLYVPFGARPEPRTELLGNNVLTFLARGGVGKSLIDP